jgi:hypothetical protein
VCMCACVYVYMCICVYVCMCVCVGDDRGVGSGMLFTRPKNKAYFTRFSIARYSWA